MRAFFLFFLWRTECSMSPRSGADLSLLQLRSASGRLEDGADSHCEAGNFLHRAVKNGHGVDWRHPDLLNLELSDEDRATYDQVIGSLEDGMDPQVFLLFFGYARSGHSMIGSLLDAHPNAAVANEFDAIKAYQSGDSRDMLLRNLVAVSTAYKLVGRCQAGYHYDIPGVTAQPYGAGKLRVIGDKDGGCNARKHLSIPELVEFQQYIGQDVSLIHVVRNPYDIVATSFAGNTKSMGPRYHQQHDVSQHTVLAEDPTEVEGNQHFVDSLNKFVDLVLDEMTYNMQVRDWIAKGELPGYRWIDVSYTDFLQDPTSQLERLCDFLSLDCQEEDYVTRAASIVRPAEHASRHELIWPQNIYDRLHAAVERVRADYPDGAQLWASSSPPRHIGAFQPLQQ